MGSSATHLAAVGWADQTVGDGGLVEFADGGGIERWIRIRSKGVPCQDQDLGRTARKPGERSAVDADLERCQSLDDGQTSAGVPRQSTDKVRYADTDRQGHVNNAVFASFLETGRVEILYDPERPLTADGAEFVIARLSLDFRGEIRWPGSVTVGTGVRRIGSSSLTLSQAVYQDDRCVAHAETVIVQVDTVSRRARPLTVAAKTRFEDLRVGDT